MKQKQKILVVLGEDDSKILKNILSLIDVLPDSSSNGGKYEIHLADSIKEAIAFMEESDLLSMAFFDKLLLEQEGKQETLAKIAMCKNRPIIVITPHVLIEFVHKFMELGGYGSMDKVAHMSTIA